MDLKIELADYQKDMLSPVEELASVFP